MKEFPGAFPREMPDVVRGWGAEEEAEVSNGGSRGGFVFGMRGTLDGVEKEIPIPKPRRRRSDRKLLAISD